MTAPDILALLDADAERAGKMGALAGAATEAPWVDRGSGVTSGTEYVALGMRTDSDAEFIAASRTETPWLVERLRARDAAIRAVLGLCERADERCDFGTVSDGHMDRSATIVLTTDLRRALASALGGGAE